MAEIGFSLQKNYDCSQKTVVKMLCDAGFFALSPIWSPELAMEELANTAYAHHMTIQSLHAPYGGLAHLWNSKSPEAPGFCKKIIDCIDA